MSHGIHIHQLLQYTNTCSVSKPGQKSLLHKVTAQHINKYNKCSRKIKTKEIKI